MRGSTGRASERAVAKSMVIKRRGRSGGIEGMSVAELPAYLKGNWPMVRSRLTAGRHQRRRCAPRRRVLSGAGGIPGMGWPDREPQTRRGDDTRVRGQITNDRNEG